MQAKKNKNNVFDLPGRWVAWMVDMAVAAAAAVLLVAEMGCMPDTVVDLAVHIISNQ